MRNIETTTTIAADAQTVWQILTDFERYPQWNPFIKRLEGPAREGEPITAQLSLDGEKVQTFRPKVLRFNAGREFRWLGHLILPGLFDGEHYFRLEPLPNGHTRLVHGEHFRGLLAGLVLRFIGAQTRAGFERMNGALKERAEAVR